MSGRDLAERLVTLHGDTKVLYTSGYTDSAIVDGGVLRPAPTSSRSRSRSPP